MRRLTVASLAMLACALPALGQQKHKVAVLDFNYGAVMSQSQAIFGTNADIGKGISDILVDKLINDGKFRVIERNAIAKVMAEQNFANSDRADPASAAKIGKILGVDAIITGDITQFGRDDQNKNLGGMLGKWDKYGVGNINTSKSKAVVGITVRLVDASTGEILASTTGKGESTRSGTSLLGGGAGNGGYGAGGGGMNSTNFAQTIIGEAVNLAVGQVALGLEQHAGALPVAAPIPVNGVVADASTSDVIINVGGAGGVQLGQKLVVTRVSRVIKDPVTGKPLRSIETPVGLLVITSVDAGSAVGTFTGTGKPKVGDTVKSE